MKPFQHIELQLAYGLDLNELASKLVSWQTVTLPDGTKLHISRTLLEWENRQSQGI